MSAWLRAAFACTIAVGSLLTAASGLAFRAEETLVAVAANFAPAIARLEPVFTEATGHTIAATTGSTGKLYAQIVAGAPFQVLLAADAETPARLESEKLAVAGSRFTYAIGKLALWSRDPTRIRGDGRAALTEPGLRFVAIANPDLAPYGVAARAVLQSLGLWDDLAGKIVMGENIGQTHSMVATGAAEIGFVALSAVQRHGQPAEGSHWDVPQNLFPPIRQDAVLLQRGAEDPAARAFLEFLRSPAARNVIEGFGYAVE